MLFQEKEKTPDFYSLGEYEVFDLLRNSSEENKDFCGFSLQISERKSSEIIDFLLKTFRFSQIDLEILLEMIQNHKDLKKSPFFQEKLSIEVFKRISGNFDKGKLVVKEIIDWLVKQEGFSDKSKELLEKLKEKDEENKKLIEKLKKKEADISNLIEEMKKMQERGFNVNNVNINRPPINILNHQNLSESEERAFRLDNCLIF